MCNDRDYDTKYIYVYNETNENIYVCGWSSDKEFILTPNYVFNERTDLLQEIRPKCNSLNKGLLIVYDGTEKSVSHQIIIFKQSTLDKYTKEELIENDIFDKRYVLTYEELEAMGFKIVYTGE